jgi:signal transduction histidine kinase
MKARPENSMRARPEKSMKTRPDEAQEPYIKLLDLASVLFLTISTDGVILSSNEFTRHILGQEVTGSPFSDFVVDFKNSFNWDQAVNTSESGALLLSLTGKAGLPRSFNFNFARSGESVLAIGHVDSEELEEIRLQLSSLNGELNNLTRELHKKNALLKELNEEKNRFLGMAAHDLRKPIGLILNYSDFILDEAADDLSREHLSFLQTIKNSSSFMKRLVDDFLDVSAIEAGKFELQLKSGSFYKTLESSIELNAHQAKKKGVAIDVQLEESIPQFFFDSGKIEQVITNLLSNAIEHTWPHTTISVKLRSVERGIVLSIEDRGPGISDEDKKFMFKAFEKTSARKTAGEKSTGLGLLITKKIIDAHKGSILVESEVGKGTCISFTLPTHREDE